MFFSYDSDCVIEFWSTAEDAKEAAEGYLQDEQIYKDDADGWDEGVSLISWGKVMGKVDAVLDPDSNTWGRELRAK